LVEALSYKPEGRGFVSQDRNRACVVKGGQLAMYGKGKAIPLQGLTGPEGSSRLRFPDFKTVGT
jgi:hypothetical protein